LRNVDCKNKEKQNKKGALIEMYKMRFYWQRCSAFAQQVWGIRPQPVSKQQMLLVQIADVKMFKLIYDVDLR
jgi:hypothetical protein